MRFFSVRNVSFGVVILLLVAAAIFLQNGSAIPFGIEPNTLFVSSLALFAAFAAYMLGSQEEATDEMTRRLGAFADLLRDTEPAHVAVHDFDSSFHYLAHVYNNSRDVIKTCNTIIGPAEEREIPAYKDYLAAKRRAVNGNTQWFDLISPGVPGRIYPLIFFALHTGGKYFLRVLDESSWDKCSFLNFTTIHGTDSVGSKYWKTIVGWENTPKKPASTDIILAIDSEDITSRYETHFMNLFNQCDRLITVVNGERTIDGEVAERMLSRLDLDAARKRGRECPKCRDGCAMMVQGFDGYFEVCSNFPGKCGYYRYDL